MAEYLDVRQVAAKLGVTRQRVYQLAVSRQIPHVRRGNRIFIPVAAWETYQAAQVREALAACGMEPDSAA